MTFGEIFINLGAIMGLGVAVRRSTSLCPPVAIFIRTLRARKRRDVAGELKGHAQLRDCVRRQQGIFGRVGEVVDRRSVATRNPKWQHANINIVDGIRSEAMVGGGILFQVPGVCGPHASCTLREECQRCRSWRSVGGKGQGKWVKGKRALDRKGTFYDLRKGRGAS